MALPFKYYILNEQEIESGALDLRYYTKTQADGKYVLKETGKQLIESTILTDLTDGGNTTLHKHDDKADKIYATNLVTNGDFSNGTTGWSASASSLSSSSNTLIVTASGTSAYGMAYQDTSIASLVGKKIYFRSKVRVTNTLCSAIDLNVDGISGGTDQTSYLNAPTQNTWYAHSFIATQPSGVSGNIRLKITHSYVDAATANGKVMEVQYVQALDLTTIFGAGNEPTKEQMDRLLSIYPNSWFNGTAEITNIKQVFNEKADRLFATNLVTNGDFSNGTTGWSSSMLTIAAIANECVATLTAINAYSRIMRTLAGLSSTDKLFIRYEIFPKYTMNAGIRLSSVDYGVKSCPANTWTSISAVIPKGAENEVWLFHDTRNSYVIGDQYKYRLVQIDNLTAIFGAGKEPTKEQMDWLLAQKYTNSWFDGTKELTSITDLLTLVNTKANSTQEAWITPTLQNGATQFDSTNFPIGYYKDSVNIVRIRGLMNGISASGVVMNLPSGYRPPKAVYFITRDGATNVKRGYIATDGNVYMYYDGTYSAYYLLDGISFRAA